MKKLLAMILAAVMLLSLAACDNKVGQNDGNKDTEAKVTLKTFEMTTEPAGVEELARVSVGYPENFAIEVNDWSVILTDEKKDVQIEVYILCDYDCYAINQEYAEEEYYYYEEVKLGDHKGYACLVDEYSSMLDVYLYMGCVAEMDDVYMCFSIGSASFDLDADPKELYQLEEVQQVLKSVVYTAPEK